VRVDSFEQFVRGGLALEGVEISEAEVQIMRYIDTLYGPDMRALEAADLSGVFAEADLDPSRAPNPGPRL
jgi:hypothetical protein